MLTENNPKRNVRGFSLVELLIVAAVMLIVAAFAVPTVVKTMDGMRVRGSLNSAVSLAQRTRYQAIKGNVTERLHVTTVSGQAVLFTTDLSDTNTAPVGGDLLLHGVIWMPTQIAINVTPATTLTGTGMWGSNVTPIVNQDIYFNSRGMPCATPSGSSICSPTTGYVYYFQYVGSSGSRWAALSVSPAGRIESWFWDGGTWEN